MTSTMAGKDGEPATAIPNRDGYFEFRLPKPFFEDNPKAVSLVWVDFFRRRFTGRIRLTGDRPRRLATPRQFASSDCLSIIGRGKLMLRRLKPA